MTFEYGEKEMNYLKQKDKRLGMIIDKIGKIEHPVDTDLFSSVIHHIIGQQISTKAQQTIWQRMKESLGVVNADKILKAGRVNLQAIGISFRMHLKLKPENLILKVFGVNRTKMQFHNL